MNPSTAHFPLRLPLSIKNAAQKIAAEDGASLNQFIALAVAEKVAVLRAETIFTERKARGNPAQALALLRNKERQGEPPRQGDELQ